MEATGGLPARELLIKMAESQLALGRLPGAVKSYEDVEQLEQTAQGQYRLAKLYQAQGRQDDYRRMLRSSLELDPGLSEARLDLALTKAAAGDLSAAEKELLQAVEANPYDARALYNYGVLRLDRGDSSGARSYFERALKVRPNYHQARYAVLELAFQAGDTALATRRLEELQRLAPSSPFTRQAERLMQP